MSFHSIIPRVLKSSGDDQRHTGHLEMRPSVLRSGPVGISTPCLLWWLEFISFSFFFFFFLFRVAAVAYGSSQARGWIGTADASYTTATATPDLSHVWDLHHSSQQHWIPNPLSKAPGIEPSTSRFLVRFVSTVPRWELNIFFNPPCSSYSWVISLLLCTALPHIRLLEYETKFPILSESQHDTWRFLTS